MAIGAALSSEVGTVFMAGVKRLARPGFVIAVVGHMAVLLALLLVRTEGARSVPPEPVIVEIVPSDDIPKVEGTPLDSTSQGSEVSSDSKTGSASTAAPRPKLELPSLQQSQARMTPEGGGKPADTPPQAAPPAEGETPPLPSEAPVSSIIAAVRPESAPDEGQQQPSVGELFAMPLVLPGGRIGSGVEAAASNPAMLPHDDTAAFRAHLGSCSKLPDWVGMNQCRNPAAGLLQT
jgi:hypothetical protein